MPEDRDELSIDELATASGGNESFAEPVVAANTNACASGANCHCTGGT
jgi:hypothetical protein